VPLLLFTSVGRAETLLIATIIGVLSTLIEAAAWRGLDNLLIPVGAFAFLKLYMAKTPGELGLRLGATLALLIFVLAWRRRTRLDDGALMAGALFGSLPVAILYSFFVEYYVSGLTGAVKE